MQLQISKIDNGFLVATPTQLTEKDMRTMSQEQLAAKQQQPQVHFCGDYGDVCDYIKRFFFTPGV